MAVSITTIWVKELIATLSNNDAQHNDDILYCDAQDSGALYNDAQHNDILLYDAQYNDAQYNNDQYNDAQYNDAQYNDAQHDGIRLRRMTHSIMTFSAMELIVTLSILAFSITIRKRDT